MGRPGPERVSGPGPPRAGTRLDLADRPRGERTRGDGQSDGIRTSRRRPRGEREAGEATFLCLVGGGVVVVVVQNAGAEEEGAGRGRRVSEGGGS